MNYIYKCSIEMLHSHFKMPHILVNYRFGVFWGFFFVDCWIKLANNSFGNFEAVFMARTVIFLSYTVFGFRIRIMLAP